MLHAISVQHTCNIQNHPFSLQLFKFLACVSYFLFSFAYLLKFLTGSSVEKLYSYPGSAVILSLALGNSLLKFILGRFVVCLVCKGRMSISENAAFFCVCVYCAE